MVLCGVVQHVGNVAPVVISRQFKQALLHGPQAGFNPMPAGVIFVVEMLTGLKIFDQHVKNQLKFVKSNSLTC